MTFVILFVISFSILLKDYFAYKKTNDSHKQLLQEVTINKVAEKETKKEKNTSKTEDKPEKIQIDWEKLEKINLNIIGWIRIDDTKINYPILQDDNNLTYLKHAYDGSYNTNGAIFTLTKKPFEEKITTIYGHNTKTGLMFSELDNYMKLDFFKKHSRFEIDTQKQKYRANVFSCYSIGVETEERNRKGLTFEEEIAYYQKQSKYFVQDIGKIEKIVKLSTCSYLNNHTVPTNQRYYIIAKLEAIES